MQELAPRRPAWLLGVLLCALVACGDDSGGGSGDGGLRDGGADASVSLSCDQLLAAYTAAYRAARTCDIAVSSLQCTALRPTTINCGCQGAVQASQTARLDELRAEWTLDKCLALCPAIACRQVTGGTCMVTATAEGACTDLP